MANLHLGACFALLAACSGAALADDPVRAEEYAKTGTRESEFASGLSVRLDPRTGRPGRDPSVHRQPARMPPASRRDDSKLTYETIPGVGVLMHTNGQMEMSSWVRLRADGTIDAYCLPHARDDLASVRGPRP